LLSATDQQHLAAAQAWLELGNFKEAKAELHAIDSAKASEPEVIRVVCAFLGAARQWQSLAELAVVLRRVRPELLDGHIHLATALDELNRTAEAREVLLAVVEKFPKAYPVPFGLACCCCKLGNLDEGRQWWNKVKKITRSKKLLEIARNTPELHPLWRR
jgi:hypothetical protein